MQPRAVPNLCCGAISPVPCAEAGHKAIRMLIVVCILRVPGEFHPAPCKSALGSAYCQSSISGPGKGTHNPSPAICSFDGFSNPGKGPAQKLCLYWPRSGLCWTSLTYCLLGSGCNDSTASCCHRCPVECTV